MKTIILSVEIAFLFFILSCRGAQEAPVTLVEKAGEKPLSAYSSELQSWEKEWNDTLAIAKKEGKVVVYSTSGAEVRKAFIEAFPKGYGISLEMLVARASEISNKILTEQRAGLHIVDVYMGGSPIITELMPANAVDPIRPTLILSEVIDPEKWWGKRLPIVADKEKKYVFQYGAALSSRDVLINTDLIKEREINSFHDLLQSRWKGKMALRDPTSTGGGLTWFGVSLASGKLDLDYMKQLANQDLFISRDDRLGVEWVARGKLMVGIALATDSIKEFKDLGLNINEINLKESVVRITSGGGGSMALIKQAPHPKAARIFINWLASREGQMVWSIATGHQSARIDVPTGHLERDKIRVPDAVYFQTLTEDYIKKQVEYVKLAREIFGPFLR